MNLLELNIPHLTSSLFNWQWNEDLFKLFLLFTINSGQANVIAVKACIRRSDHVVIIMPYFEHDRFQVRFERYWINTQNVTDWHYTWSKKVSVRKQ